MGKHQGQKKEKKGEVGPRIIPKKAKGEREPVRRVFSKPPPVNQKEKWLNFQEEKTIKSA